MATLAMRLASIVGRDSVAPQNVFHHGDWFKVIWIDTARHTTHVIQRHPHRDIPHYFAISHAVCVILSIGGDPAIASSGNRSLPEPATIFA